MTTITHNRNRRRGPSPSTWVSMFVVAIIVVAVLLARRSLGGAAVYSLVPANVAHAVGASMVGNVVASLSSNASLAAQNAALSAELASTTAVLADRNALYQENLDLKARLGRNASVQTTLAAVVSRPPQTPYDIFTIDAGTADGVAAGDWVASGGTTLVGVVSEVSAHSSRVVLFSTPGQSYGAIITLNDGTSVPVSVEGQGSGSMTTQVPAGTTVAVGNPVVFPSITGGFVAYVSAVQSVANQSFITLYMHMPVDPLSLQYVEVWTHHVAQQ